MKVKVTRVFRDMFTKHLYEVGMELEFSDEARVENLVERGLVEVIEEQEIDDVLMITVFEKEFEKKVVIDALKAIGEKTAWNMKDEKVLFNISELDADKVAALKTALGIE